MPIKCLSKFFRSSEILLISCEVSLDLKWNENCVLTSRAYREADPDAGPVVVGVNNPTVAEFKITHCKLYVPTVTLPKTYDNILYRKLKEGFFVDVYCERYRSEMTNQKAGSINYLIDSTFDNVSRLSVLAFEDEDDRYDFKDYYTPTREITDYNVLINQKPFFEIPARNKKETYEIIGDVSKSINEIATGNLLSYDYFLNHYKLILAQQHISLDKQQINFIEETRKTSLKFSQNYVDIEEEKFSKKSVDSEES